MNILLMGARAFLLPALLWLSLTGLASAQESLETQVQKICLIAKAASQELDFSRVEKLRRERLSLLHNANDDSPWSGGARAIRMADSLIDKLQYKQACEVLRAAWKPFNEVSDGPVLGDIALKFFEVTQAGLVVYPNCLQEGDTTQIATEKEILALIEAAVTRDPCAVEAQVVLAYLTRPDPHEAFSRAEVRPSLQSRNRALLKLTYSGQGPIMPWHAPVEMLKAENFSAVLDDVDFCRNVLLRGVVNQLTGWDARYEPFEVVGDSFLLMRLPNAKGYETPALLYLLPNRKKPEWRKLDMRILLVDREGDSKKVAIDSSTIRRHLEAAQPTFEQRLGKCRLRLFDVPSVQAEAAIHELNWLFLENFKRVETAIKEAERDLVKNPNLLSATLAIPAEEVKLSLTGAKVNFNLQGDLCYEVESMSSVGPILVFSQDTKTAIEPPFITSAADLPYLLLSDGNKLFFNLAARRMEIRYPSASAYITLTPTAVPAAFALATEDGSFVEEFLVKAGYTGSGEAARELMKVVADPRYKPSKLSAKRIDIKVHQSVNELRKTTDGFRYLEDKRGRLIASRQSLGNATDDEDESPYRMFSQDGKELKDTDTTYKAADYQSLYANVVGDFLPRALWLEPSAPLWKRLEVELYRMPPPRDGLTWKVHGELDKKISQPWGAGGPGVSHSLQPLNALPQRNDLAEAVRPGFWDLNCAAYKPRDGKAYLLMRVDGKPKTIEVGHKVLGNRRTATTAGQPLDGNGAWDTLVAIYRRQAVRDAVAGRFHRAIVGYQDVLERLEAAELNLDFFKSIPDEKKLKDFEISLISYVSSQEKNVIARAELAAVLRSAGLKESAEFLERGLLDQFQLSTLPVIEAAIEYANSYGYKEPPELAVTRQRIESHLREIEKAEGHDSLRHIRLAFESEKFDDNAAAHLDKLASLFEQAEARKRTTAKEIEVPLRKHLFELQQMPRSALVWLAEKKLLLANRPQWLIESADFPQPNLVCPADPSEAEPGFTKMLAALLDGIEPKQLTEWAMADESRQHSHQDSGKFHFLLAWYWLEQDNAINARNAFVASARAFSVLAGIDHSLPSMIARRNAILALIAAAAISELPPGVSVFPAQYINELSLQMLMWKRKWVSLGFPPEKSEREHQSVLNVIDLVQKQSHLATNADLDRRYFFFDHRFEHGAIPDVLIDAMADRMTAALEAHAAKTTKDSPASASPTLPSWDEVKKEFQFPKTFDAKVMSLGRPK
jgi:hypothetical protein